MRKKVFTMLLVSIMALNVTACGGKETEEVNNTVNQPVVEQNVEEKETTVSEQETVVETEETVQKEAVIENTGNEVVEGDAPIEGDAPLDDDVDSGTTGNETIDLTNTTILNVGEKFGATIELPVFTFAYYEDTIYYGYYKTNNVTDDNKVYEVYSLKIGNKKKNISATEANTYIAEQCAEMSSTDNYLKVETAGTESSNYIVAGGINKIKENGSSLEIIDVYYIYDPATACVYELNVAIAKDSAMFGADVMEKSTATYREELFNAVLALAN